MAVQLCACGDAQKSDQQEASNAPAQDIVGETDNVSPTADAGSAGEDSGAAHTDTEASGDEEDGSGSAEAIVYEYEQELNIIDDNYRNYYEIFVYSFYDSDGDGIGDLNGVIQKLDYIQEMGFNGIWMMPIMQSPTYHKYDVVDYCSIDEAYGTVEDFQKLVEECHKRDINVVIDFVINHSSSEHQWFADACAYLKDLPEGQE
ncbi:MAG: alpha amylase, partial [Lachnospiraceae bacterium]|nr:alpha amylase [Lachnospiraceae bacterium]